MLKLASQLFGDFIFHSLCFSIFKFADLECLAEDDAGFILMEYTKEKVKDKSLGTGLAKSAAFVDCCNLLKFDVEDILSIEEIKACIGFDLKKRRAKRKVSIEVF